VSSRPLDLYRREVQRLLEVCGKDKNPLEVRQAVEKLVAGMDPATMGLILAGSNFPQLRDEVTEALLCEVIFVISEEE